MLRTPRSLILAASALLALASSLPQAASAQMVPRLASYPKAGTIQTACAPYGPSLSERRTMEYARGTWRETTVVYQGAECKTALYTVQAGGAYEPGRSNPWIVAYRTVTPAPNVP